MADNRNNGDFVSQNVLDWLTRVGGIATALTTIIGLFFQNNEEAQRIAYGLAILLGTASLAIYYYRRQRAKRFAIPKVAEPLAPTAALRGLLPFEEGDELPGRARDAQDLITLVKSRGFRFGVLWGESGSGKTSLLRAELVPRLRESGYLPLYIPKPTSDPRAAIVAAIEKEDDYSFTLPKGQTLIVILDQFEEFFLTNRTPSSRSGLSNWLGKSVKNPSLPVAFLLSIRADFFAHLQTLVSKGLPDPTSTRTTYQLHNFDIKQAKQVLDEAANVDAIPFEPVLIDAIVNDLEIGDFIRPAELQIVATGLKRKNITSLNRYEVEGRARTIISSYIGTEIKQSVNERVARLVLRSMIAEDGLSKSPENLSLNNILHQIGGAQQVLRQGSNNNLKQEVQNILDQFVAGRILIRTDDDHYNLVHDYLASYVLAATAGTETRAERTNRLLRRYVAEYRDDPKTRLPFRYISEIRKYASADIREEMKAQELMTKSMQAIYLVGVEVLAAVLIIVSVLYLFLANSYYMGVENPKSLGAPKQIVVYEGRPGWWVPFPDNGQVIIQTDFTIEDTIADPTIRAKFEDKNLTGFQFTQVNGYADWANQLEEHLSPISQAQTLRWLNQPEQAIKILVLFVTDPQVKLYSREAAFTTLELLTEANPQAVTAEVVQPLIDIATDPQFYFYGHGDALTTLELLTEANPQVVTAEVVQSLIETITNAQFHPAERVNAASVLAALAKVNPQVVTTEVVQSLIDVVTDSQYSSSRHWFVFGVLELLTEANPQAVTAEVVQSLIDIATDPQVDFIYDRTDAASVLAALAEANPQAVTAEVTAEVGQSLTDIATDPQFYSFEERLDAAEVLELLAKTNPQVVTAEVVQSLIDIATHPQVDSSDDRTVAAMVLAALAEANPQVVSTMVTAEVVQSLIELGINSQVDSSERYGAASVLEVLAKANPQVVTAEVVQSLFELGTNPQVDSSERHDAASVLEVLAKANPQVVTAEVVQSLIDIVTDPQVDFYGRNDALATLEALAEANPQVVSTEVGQSLIDIATDPQFHSSERHGAARVLKVLAETNPQVVTAEVGQSLIDIGTDPQFSGSGFRFAGFTLEALAEANPQVVTAEVVQSLIDIGTGVRAYSSYSSDRTEALSTLEALAEANPQVVSTVVTAEVVQSLIDIVIDPQVDSQERDGTARALAALSSFEYGLIVEQSEYLGAVDLPYARKHILSALGRARYVEALKSMPSDPLAELFRLLENKDYAARTSAAYALFLLLINDPGQEQKDRILGQLAEMRMSSKPHLRIAASKTLEMWTIGDLVNDVVNDDPEKVSSIKSRLNQLSHLQEAHIEFATSVALKKIAEIEKAQNQ